MASDKQFKNLMIAMVIIFGLNELCVSQFDLKHAFDQYDCLSFEPFDEPKESKEQLDIYNLITARGDVDHYRDMVIDAIPKQVSNKDILDHGNHHDNDPTRGDHILLHKPFTAKWPIILRQIVEGDKLRQRFIGLSYGIFPYKNYGELHVKDIKPEDSIRDFPWTPQ